LHQLYQEPIVENSKQQEISQNYEEVKGVSSSNDLEENIIRIHMKKNYIWAVMKEFDKGVEDWRIIAEKTLNISRINTYKLKKSFEKTIPDPIKVLIEDLKLRRQGAYFPWKKDDSLSTGVSSNDEKEESKQIDIESSDSSEDIERQFEPPFGVIFQNFNFSEALTYL